MTNDMLASALGWIGSAAVLGLQLFLLRRRKETVRILIDRRGVRGAGQIGLGLLAATAPALTAGPAGLRAAAVFAVLLLAPGAAIVGFRPARDALDELVLAVALSIGVLVLTALLMLSFRYQWSPPTLLCAVAFVAGPVLVWHGARSLQAPSPDPSVDTEERDLHHV
jgi:hypothetical protein